MNTLKTVSEERQPSEGDAGEEVIKAESLRMERFILFKAISTTSSSPSSTCV